MRNGSIDTQILDLAGLGVIPWLFTKSPGPTAPIVCLQAPFSISNGRISTKQAVVETDQVQVVVLGHVDLGNQTLEVVGQPRRIGKPLSRSPWPFTLSGSLNKPKVKVKMDRAKSADRMGRQECLKDARFASLISCNFDKGSAANRLGLSNSSRQGLVGLSLFLKGGMWLRIADSFSLTLPEI